MELRPLAASDVDDVTELIADPTTLRYTRVPEPPPEGFAQGWYERYEQGRATRTKEAFAIVGDDGAFLGLALAPTIDEMAAEAEHRARSASTCAAACTEKRRARCSQGSSPVRANSFSSAKPLPAVPWHRPSPLRSGPASHVSSPPSSSRRAIRERTFAVTALTELTFAPG